MIHESLQWRQVHNFTVVQTLSFGIFIYLFFTKLCIDCVDCEVDSVYLDIVFSVGETFYHSFK